MSADDQAPRVPAGWTLDEERHLGDHIQQAIGRQQQPPEVTAEDQAAEQIIRRTLEGWPSYEPGDDA